MQSSSAMKLSTPAALLEKLSISSEKKEVAPLAKSSAGNREVNELVNNKFKILDKLGEGSFGEVRLAKEVQTGIECAIKFEHKSDVKYHLRTEYEVYKALGNEVPGFAQAYWYGKHGDYRALVMECCGKSVKTLFDELHVKCFPLETVALIAIQMLTRLQMLHNVGWLHQDIKPENMVIGTEKNKNTIYLIDFGTSGQYIDQKTKSHRRKGPSKKIVGTARYSSLNNHLGYKQSRKDDLESLGYTLLFWALGKLPWQGINQHDFRLKWTMIRQIKQDISMDQLCKDLPVQFRVYMKYVMKLSYEQTPNYSYLRGLFRQLLSEQVSTDSSTPIRYRYAWDNIVEKPAANQQN